MKFKNRTTGVVLEPNTKAVEEMLKASTEYEEIKETKKKSTEKVD